MLVFVRTETNDIVQQLGVSLIEVGPAHHERRSKLTAGDVEESAGCTVTIRTETSVVGILLRGGKHI